MNLSKTPPFYYWDDDTLVLNIIGRPNSKKDAIGVVIGHQLEVYAAAIPRQGGATAHMIQYLAGIFCVPKVPLCWYLVKKMSTNNSELNHPSNCPP